MRACHLGRALTEPALVVRTLPNPLEVDSGPPVSRTDLGCRAHQGVPHLVQARLLGGRRGWPRSHDASGPHSKPSSSS